MIEIAGLEFYNLLVIKSVAVGLMLGGVSMIFGWAIGHAIRLFKVLS